MEFPSFSTSVHDWFRLKRLEPKVHYLVGPFQNTNMHQAQTSVPLSATELPAHPTQGHPR